MANIERDRHSKRILIGVIIFMFILLLGVMIATIAISNSGGNHTKPVMGEPKKEEPSSETEQQSTNDEEVTEPGEEGKPKPIKGEITYHSLVGDTLQIRTNISESLNDGTCSLTITGPKGQTYKDTAKIIANSSSTSTCNGFDVDIERVEKDEENRAGQWQIVIDLSLGDRAGQLKSEMTI